MGGSFWIRIRLGKAVAGPGVRGQDDRDFFFSRDSEAAFGAQSATMGGSFWMFGAKMTETNGNKLFFPKAPAKGFSLSTAAYFIFLNLFLLLHLPHSLFLTLFLLLHLPHSLFLTLFILLHLPYFIFFTNFLLLHPHNIII